MSLKYRIKAEQGHSRLEMTYGVSEWGDVATVLRQLLLHVDRIEIEMVESEDDDS